MALVADGGLPWLLTATAAAAGTLGLALRSGTDWLAWASLPLWVGLAFLAWFFRDPDRMVAPGVCSPADGKVVRIDVVQDEGLGTCDRLSIFMSPLDVHVNRCPVPGTVASVTHRPGTHIPAFDKDSDNNERVETTIEGHRRVKVVQIAGAVARRIVPYIGAGQTVAAGERLGLIRLGSRCDLLVPQGNVQWAVRVGDQVRAGSSHVAGWSTDGPSEGPALAGTAGTRAIDEVPAPRENASGGAS